MTATEALKKTRIRFQEAKARVIEDWEKFKAEREERNTKWHIMTPDQQFESVRNVAKVLGKFEAKFEMYDMIDGWLTDRIIEALEDEKKLAQASAKSKDFEDVLGEQLNDHIDLLKATEERLRKAEDLLLNAAPPLRGNGFEVMANAIVDFVEEGKT